MGLRQALLNALTKEKTSMRGKNPNSLANLKYVTRDGDVASPVAPVAPRAPPPAPVNPTVEFFNGLKAMEEYRNSVIATEEARRQAAIREARAFSFPQSGGSDLKTTIREVLEEFDDGEEEDDGDDEMLEKAAGVLFSALKEGRKEEAPPAVVPPPEPVTATPPAAPGTTFDPSKVVQMVEEENPGIIEMVRSGAISRKKAVKRLLDEGFTEAEAEAIYTEAMK